MSADATPATIPHRIRVRIDRLSEDGGDGITFLRKPRSSNTALVGTNGHDDDLRRIVLERSPLEVPVPCFDAKAGADEQVLELRGRVPAHLEFVHDALDVVARANVVDELHVVHLPHPVHARDAKGPPQRTTIRQLELLRLLRL